MTKIYTTVPNEEAKQQASLVGCFSTYSSLSNYAIALIPESLALTSYTLHIILNLIKKEEREVEEEEAWETNLPHGHKTLGRSQPLFKLENIKFKTWSEKVVTKL